MKPPTVFLGEMTDPEVEAFLRDHRTVIVPTGSTEQHGPHGPLLTDVFVPVEVARRVAPRTGALVAPVDQLRAVVSRTPASPASSTCGSRRSWRSSRTSPSGWRRWASGGSCSSTATTTTPTRSRTPARTPPARLPDGARAFPVNYWDGMTADEAAEYFGPTAGLHANRAETSAVHGDRSGARRHRPRQRGDAAVPRGDEPRRGAHRLLLLDAGLGPSGDRSRDVGRRPRVAAPSTASATSQVVTEATVADARRRRADVRGDAAALSGGSVEAAGQPASAANQVPARMTRRTRRSRSSSTRSARWPTAIRPRSAIPSMASGLRLAAATAAGSGTPDATRLRDRRVERDDRPGQRPRSRQGHALPRRPRPRGRRASRGRRPSRPARRRR